MVPSQWLSLENEDRYDSEHGERNHLLNHFQLHQVEGAAMLNKADTIGWNHHAIFKKATPHDAKIIRISGQSVVIFISSNLRCPYHAKVMKTLETTNMITVRKALINFKLKLFFTPYINIKRLAKVEKKNKY